MVTRVRQPAPRLQSRHMSFATQIFICYRRRDTPTHAGRLHDALSQDFGKAKVFIDIEAIEPGQDFEEAIRSRLTRCAVLLVLIGPNWDSALLCDAKDFVRIEIETAMSLDIHVIPVSMNGGTIPAPSNLPEGIRPLAKRQMYQMTDRDWRTQYAQLSKFVRKEIRRRRREHVLETIPAIFALLRRQWRATLAAIIVLAILVLKGPATDSERGLAGSDTTGTTTTREASPLGLDLTTVETIPWSSPRLQRHTSTISAAPPVSASTVRSMN